MINLFLSKYEVYELNNLAYTQSEMFVTEEHKSRSNSTVKQMEYESSLATNPAGAPTMTAINSAKTSNKNNTVSSNTGNK